MSRFGKKVGLSTLLLAVFLAATGKAGVETAADDPNEKLRKDIEEIRKAVEAVKRDVEVIRAKEMDGFNRVADLEKKLDALRDALESIGRAVAQIDNTTRNSARTARAFEPGGRPGTGTIKLQNTSAFRATVVIGGVPYDVQPGETRELRDRPAGNFDYLVQADGFGQISAQVSRTLDPGGTFTIFINPPRQP